MSANLFIRKDLIKPKYELSFREKDNSFLFKIQAKDLEFFKSLETTYLINHVRNTELTYSLKKQWDFTSETVFGYEGCMSVVHLNNHEVVLESKVTLNTGRSIILTFIELFRIFQYIIENERAVDNLEQEVFLNVSCTPTPEMYGAAMHADLSAPFSLWLYDQSDTLRTDVNSRVNSTMAKLVRVLLRQKSIIKNNVGLVEHGFNLEPPLGIYTCQFATERELLERGREYPEHFGYETFCHNLDNWIYELILLAGFAIICETYRNSRTKK